MSNFKFVSHESFPQDPYISELVYLMLDEKYRVAYVRKQLKNGGRFWSVPTMAISKDGSKSYYDAFLQDSSFLDKDIKKFLEGRLWERMTKAPSVNLAQDSDLPF